ncbi:hypothetical protein ACPC39_20410 [Streptomyces cellulosae]
MGYDTARRKLVTEKWDTEGPWRLWWTSCGSSPRDVRRPPAGADGASQDTETLEGLRNLLERAAEQVREAGYGLHGDWTVNWTECRVLLTDRAAGRPDY